tara:strand:- start:227 stop:670 length:444 start_codon:yes stop_codon:yes gene_type:complete
MKLSIFKKMIREVIREELDYKFSRLSKELKEVVVKSNTNDLNKARTHTTQDTSLKTMMMDSTGTDSNVPITKGNVSVPKTSNNVLNALLEETAQSDDWKTVRGTGQEVQSVQDNTEALPNHLAEALTKDYSAMLKSVEEKDNFKNGA